jgi:hypothetical protein
METLAADIGNRVYLDIANWHLYLNDAHLHTPLAEKLYPLLSEDRISEAEVRAVLQGFSVAVGGGATELPLLQLMPRPCLQDLIELLEEKHRELF